MNLPMLRPLPRVSLALLAAAWCVAVPASGHDAVVMPAVSSPASAEHHAGKLIWVDLVTPDLAAAEQFYGGLLGWTFHTVGSGEGSYAWALNNGEAVAGLFQRVPPTAEKRQPAWVSFLAVDDVDAARTSALAHGAELLASPRDVAGRGRQAIFRDPQGAVFGVLASSSGDPADELADPGAWIWSSLLTKDAGSDAAFYQQLLGYEVFELPSEDGLEHLILSSENYARASVHTLPADGHHRHPHWLSFVRVTDVGESSARAASLGGRVLVEPRMDREGNRIAVIADPTGAPLGLMEWTDTQSSGEAQ